MSDSLLYTISGIVSAALAAVLWKRRAALWLKIFLVCFALFAFAFSDGKHEFDLLKLTGLALLGTFGLTFWKSIIERIRSILGFGNDAPTGGVRRGSEVANAQAVAKSLKKVRSRFDIGGVPVPVDLETRSFLFAGSPGSGKSQALMRSLDSLESSGARAIIADPSGQYCARFYSDSRGDVILNPHDARSVSWSPLSEIETAADIPALAKSLVPDAEGESRAWSNYAQQFIEAVLEHAFNNDLKNGDIFEIVTSAPLDKLQQICAGTPAAAMVQAGNERMFASVRASATDAITAMRYLDPAAGRDAFSIRRHIVEQRPGWIFLSYQQNHRAGLARLICAALDVASRAVLSLPPDLNRRVIFALDELPLLGKVQSIVELLTNGRKHGAVAFVGLQTVAQLREAYGRETSQTLLACLGSWLVLRVSDAETADFMSRCIGEQEIDRYVQSNSSSNSWQHVGSTDSTTTTQQIVTQRAILPSQLQQLQDMCGYFNLAGPTPVAFVRLQYAKDRHQADAFAPAAPRPRRQQPAPAAPEQQPAGTAQQVEDLL
jgi:type IV secretory pathway TraG/TraD family ATPase VirD4